MEQTHKCSKCGKEKRTEDYPHAKGKRHSWCRDCHKLAKAEYRRKYRETNPRKKRIAEDYLTEDGRAICAKCNKPHPLDHYQGGNGGGWCRACRTSLEISRRRENGVSAREMSVIENDRKLCMHCKEMKTLCEFYPLERGLGGVTTYCKPCLKVRYYNRESARIQTAKYRKANRERHLAAHRVRMFEYRTRKKVLSDGTATDEFLRVLYAQETCHYCGKYTEREDRTADHKTPLVFGGPHSADNLVMACWTCNSSKRDLPYEDFLNKAKELQNGL